MSIAGLEIVNLGKRFGRQLALDGLSLSIPKNAVAGLVGANGAGKTTTFSIIAGSVRRDFGEVMVLGCPLIQFRRLGGIVGVLPQDVQFFESRGIRRYLELFSRLAGRTRHEALEEVDYVLDLVSLGSRSRDRAETLSHGMMTRLGIAQAIIGEPQLLLLDEPTAGLDPHMVEAFCAIIEKLRGTTTIVISSHDLAQVEKLCDYLCIVDNGKLIKQGRMQEVLSTSSRVKVMLGVSDFELRIISGAMPQFKFTPIDATSFIVEFAQDRFTPAEVNRHLLQWLIAHEVPILSIDSQKKLEEAYLETVE